MKNLQKFTKSELINKLKSQNLEKQVDQNQGVQNQSYLHKIVDFILSFKTLILKITLIAFILRWIKKYSLARKIWQVFGWIASAILGISMIDIYSLEVISWIKDTSIYKWYYELFYPKEIIKEKSNNEFQFPKRITNQTIENETRSSSISEWINRNNQKEEIIEETNESIWHNYKHIIIISGVIVIISGLSWYYYSDEIKDSSKSVIDWIKSFWSSPPSDPNNSSRENIPTPTTQSSGENIQRGLRKYFKIEEIKQNISEIGLGNRQTGIWEKSDIELADIKGKGKASVLTSPSLENLNNKAEEAWAESSSPKSDDSSLTITPEHCDTSTITPNTSTSSSLEKGLTPDLLTKATIDLINKSWMNLLNPEIRNSITFIENSFYSNEELNKESADKLITSLANIISEYDIHVKLYENLSERDKLTSRITLFAFRKWLKTYHAMLLPNDTMLDIGTNNDIPTLIGEKLRGQS